MESLDQLGLRFLTDKASNSHNYLQYYSIFLEPLRDKEINLLEIGVYAGSSLRMWKEYFPFGMILGADIVPCKEQEEERISTVILDQSKAFDLIEFGEKYKNCFNVIVDDGSHHAEDQITSFESLFPFLKPGGYYFIEDCLCSYDKERWGKNADVYDRIRQMIGEVNMNGKMSNYHICANKKEERVKYNLNVFEREIEFIFVSCGLVVIKKI